MKFWKFYAWGADLKFTMALYSLGILFFLCLFRLLGGAVSVPMLDLLKIVVIGFGMSFIEKFLFPQGCDLTTAQIKKRTALWAALENVWVIGMTLVFGLFTGASGWQVPVLVLLLELMLAAMWASFALAARMDTRQLNENLNRFKSGQN